MITLTRYNDSELLINESFIETVEETPDTVVCMQNGHRYIVKESIADIYAKAAAFRKLCNNFSNENNS